MNADVVAAIEAGDLAGLKRLVASGQVPVNAKGGYPPLHEAAGCGHLEMVRYLVEEAGADPRVQNAQGITPLSIAACDGHLDIVRYLIEERGMDPTEADATVGLKLPMLQMLASLITSRFLQGCNPLHHACWSFRADVAEYLLENTRIDPLAKRKYAEYALLGAVRPLEEDEAPDQGLPILELFHRKAPKALDLPGRQGKELQSMLTAIP